MVSTLAMQARSVLARTDDSKHLFPPKLWAITASRQRRAPRRSPSAKVENSYRNFNAITAGRGWSAICFALSIGQPREETTMSVSIAQPVGDGTGTNDGNTMDPAHLGRDRDDVDLQPAIRLDPVHEILPGQPRHDPAGHPGHLLAADRAADLAVARAGLSGRQIWAAAADRRRLRPVGRRLDHLRLYFEPDRALPHLRPVLRRRHRHRLYRRDRPDGALVPGPARFRHRHGRGRLRLRRHPDHLPDRLDAQERRLPAHAGGVRLHPRRRRRACRAGHAHAESRRETSGPIRAERRERHGAEARC